MRWSRLHSQHHSRANGDAHAQKGQRTQDENTEDMFYKVPAAPIAASSTRKCNKSEEAAYPVAQIAYGLLVVFVRLQLRQMNRMAAVQTTGSCALPTSRRALSEVESRTT